MKLQIQANTCPCNPRGSPPTPTPEVRVAPLTCRVASGLSRGQGDMLPASVNLTELRGFRKWLPSSLSNQKLLRLLMLYEHPSPLASGEDVHRAVHSQGSLNNIWISESMNTGSSYFSLVEHVSQKITFSFSHFYFHGQDPFYIALWKRNENKHLLFYCLCLKGICILCFYALVRISRCNFSTWNASSPCWIVPLLVCATIKDSLISYGKYPCFILFQKKIMNLRAQT